MAVLCLIYHHTPAGPPETPWDVPLDDLRVTIDRMLDMRMSFIDLKQARDPDKLAEGLHVAITFDDGHRTNAAAFEFLASRSIRPAAFVVRDWSRDRSHYMPGSMIAEFADICDFGAHGASHTGMTYLDDQALSAELTGSRSYLEDVLGRPVDTMALPGGMGDCRVFEAARNAGYQLVCTSVEDINSRAGLRLNRMCISQSSGAAAPIMYATATPAFWRRKRLRRTAVRLSTALLGEANHSLVVGLAKGALARATGRA
jgi:peptidoglycan/xylan/chitin deacetylase (PgdA/CDA1 family)